MATTNDTPSLPSSPTMPVFARPTALEHELTMDITSAFPGSLHLHHFDEHDEDADVEPPEPAPAPAALPGIREDERAEEEEGRAWSQPPPPPPPPVRFLGINYEPDERTHPLRFDVHPPSPTPWERAAPPPSSSLDRPPAPPQPASKRAIPVSSYYFGPPPPDSAYFTPPAGQIGVHHPREIVRVERDYSGGEVVQFAPTYPLEFEGRVTPTQFLESINAINEVLISAYSLKHSVLDNVVEILSLQLSRLVLASHYEREMKRLQCLMDDLNRDLFNPAGLNLLWPRKVGFLFVSASITKAPAGNSTVRSCVPAATPARD
ncbi:Golgin subfamily A member 7/ERF4 family-domain-containing protein [Gloeopeniophorella convolvens]|nr:Golgin subfamily A member 7/ERF4 family-domain-containing protein [Gloeopeniophorella convolvens]